MSAPLNHDVREDLSAKANCPFSDDCVLNGPKLCLAIGQIGSSRLLFRQSSGSGSWCCHW